MAEIRFEKIRKQFGDVTVIGAIDLSIKDGEFFTFVGPSGCGKSTILNMIAGLEPVSEGKIYFDGAVVNDLSPGERDVAMVFQSYALYPHMTVYENIAFPLKMRKLQHKVIAEEVRRVADLLGLSEFLERRPRELSGGQRQRVALGRAIIRKPKVFLMDEPLSNLDARLRVEMRVGLKRLHQELKITTVYVTHDQGEAMSLSDRIAVLHEGAVQQCGTPLEIYLKPSNIFVAGFIGSPPMNFIPASVRKVDPLEIHCNGIILSPVVERLPEKERVIVGVRPEDIVITTQESSAAIPVTASVIEPAGSLNWVDCDWNDQHVKGYSRLNENIKPGDRAFMQFPIEKIMIFDEASNRKL